MIVAMVCNGNAAATAPMTRPTVPSTTAPIQPPE